MDRSHLAIDESEIDGPPAMGAKPLGFSHNFPGKLIPNFLETGDSKLLSPKTVPLGSTQSSVITVTMPEED
jgi:hypothetical protein